MVPDHTFTLSEGEAFFVGMEDVGSDDWIIAMRSPSYFKADLRKLKLLSLFDLQERIIRSKEREERQISLHPQLQRSARQAMNFFSSVKNCLILHPNEASRMSGGDFDGDCAFVCWDQSLASVVSDEPAESTLSWSSRKHATAQKIFWECNEEEILDFFHHYSAHQSYLGKLDGTLDKCIDRFGFGDERTREIGKAAFLQVRPTIRQFLFWNRDGSTQPMIL